LGINNTGSGIFRFIDEPTGTTIATSRFTAAGTSTFTHVFAVLLDENTVFRVQLEMFSESANINSGFESSLHIEKVQ
tara:strand:- start:518 stop:748 length:231 start_codon:yes stop_codon:yes gene_type:complete